MPEPEFVTVADAARALGVDARQVRRWVDRLEPKDKGQDTQRTHKGQPVVTVRLSAVAKLQSSPVEALQKGDSRGEAPKDTSKGQPKDTGPRPVLVSDGMSVELAEALQRAAVAEARAELLERELGDWKGQAQTLTEALRASQDEARAARLIGTSTRPTMLESVDTGEDGKPRANITGNRTGIGGFFERIFRLRG